MNSARPATRRAKITPAQAGLPDYGGRRRVPGLRREEAALLAGISVEYCTRIERGSVRGVSGEVPDGPARFGLPAAGDPAGTCPRSVARLARLRGSSRPAGTLDHRT